MARRRLDQELVRRGLVATRTEAQRVVASGLVTVGGAPALKATRLVDAGEPVLVAGPAARFVSRGGEKLDGALSHFRIDVEGLRILDAGASTGGFTDCLLQRGAGQVVAVDVGHGQLHERIRADQRVMVIERCNVRTLTRDAVGGVVEMVVADLSFISLLSVMGPMFAVCEPGGAFVFLVKPQFEAGRAEVSRGRGVIRDSDIHQRVVEAVTKGLIEAGATIMGTMESPLRGANGNVEFLIAGRTSRAAEAQRRPVEAIRTSGVVPPGTARPPRAAKAQRRPVEAIKTSVLVVAHRQRAEAAGLAVEAMTWLRAHDIDAWMTIDDARALGLVDFAAERPPESAALALSLGGDGTMLRTVEMVSGAGIPILGVNVGLMGYLTEVEPPALVRALERYLEGRFHIEERMMLTAVIHRQAGGGEPQIVTALNEVVIEKCESGHTVRLAVKVDGADFTTYSADALIVATPTGSTAYSLSARGPIVSPRHRAILVTPVSPHMLFDRSLVLDPQEAIAIEIIGHRPARAAVDGRQSIALGEGDIVTFSAADQPARFVRLGERRFHQILKAKFGLSDR